MAKKDNQKKFLEAYEKAFGNLTQACKAADINRGTYYSWRNNDPAFCERMAAMEPEEMFVDFAEHALAKKIQGGDTTAIIFALKTKGKKRGYIEKTEQEVTVNIIRQQAQVIRTLAAKAGKTPADLFRETLETAQRSGVAIKPEIQSGVLKALLDGADSKAVN